MIVLFTVLILLVILVQIIQSVGTALAVKTDRRINEIQSKRRTKR